MNMITSHQSPLTSLRSAVNFHFHGAIMYVLLTVSFLGGPVFCGSTYAQSSVQDDGTIMSVTSNETNDAFMNLQVRIKGFALVILLIALVIAAIMAAMQKTGLAISVAIGAIILYGGTYILLMLQQGLTGS